MKQQDNLILELTRLFALDIIKYSEMLEELRKYVIAKQVLSSGTSIGANVYEAQHAESRNDFIHKMKIASKEALETMYWLDLCNHSENYPAPGNLFEQLISIQKVLSRIIHTGKTNIAHNKKFTQHKIQSSS